MSCNVRRLINPDCLRDLLSIERIMKSLPKDVLICSECDEEVVIHKDTMPNPAFGLPFAKAEFIGCDTAIDKVIEGILIEGARQRIDWSDCFEGKKS